MRLFTDATPQARATPRRELPLRSHQQRPQRRVILRARRAALEVRRHAGYGGLRVRARELQLDEAVELVEADLAAHLCGGRAEHAGESVPGLLVHRAFPSESSRNPWSASCARSLRRASCSVLYSAPRVVPRRSARTSIGTSCRVIATRTARWWLVSTLAIASLTARSSSAVSASSSGPAPRCARSAPASSSSGTSRPTQARRRAFTAASSSANLYAHVVKRLCPRYV